jgi:O-antigen/teichoic acid export membrane protein
VTSPPRTSVSANRSDWRRDANRSVGDGKVGGRHRRTHGQASDGPPTRQIGSGPVTVGEPTKADLERKVRAGTRWSTLNSLVIRIVSFMIGVVLWRTVFGPTTFGLYAVSQIVLAILLSVNELGVSSAIVRWDGDIYSYARTVFTLSTATSAMMYVVLYVTAPTIARVLGSPNATTMLRVLGICVIIDAACAVPIALLTREFAQGRRMVIDFLNFGVGTGLTVWLAFAGFGAMSFAWGGLAGTSVAMVAAMVATPRFSWLE